MRSSYLTFITAGLIGFLNAVASAQIGATVTYTSTQLDPSTYQYTFTLTNTGTTNIATFWVGWTPVGYNGLPYIYDLLGGIPSVSSSPSNWFGGPVADSPFGGYSVEWYGFGTSVAPGDSLSNFTFTISDTPSQMSGPSILGIPRSTSWVYTGTNQSGGTPGDFGALAPATEVAVPEPALAGALIPLFMLGLLRHRVAQVARDTRDLARNL